MQPIRNPKDFCAGALFIAIGLATIVLGTAYTLGTAARMGSGYFPRMLGILLVVLGAILAARSFKVPGTRFTAFRWRPVLIVLGSVVLFGAIVRPLGVALATVILIVAASAASHEFRPRESLVVAVLLAALAVGVFVVGLQLQLPIWPGQA